MRKRREPLTYFVSGQGEEAGGGYDQRKREGGTPRKLREVAVARLRRRLNHPDIIRDLSVRGQIRVAEIRISKETASELGSRAEFCA